MRTLFIGLLALFLAVAATLARAGTVTYVYSDPQGTPLAEADTSGNITATFDYWPYGEQALGSSKDGLGYTGHVNDANNGLIYMQARYYDPLVGRFLSADPLDPSVTLEHFNRYVYVSNNPILNIDPDGRQDDEAIERERRGEGAAFRDTVNESIGRSLVAEIKSIDPSYKLPPMAGAEGGAYFNEVTNGVLAGDLAALRNSGPAMCMAPGAEADAQQGGAHGDIKGRPGYESHHMPADSISPLPKGRGPAILMERDDHRQTASWGSSREARAYREEQRRLIQKGDFRGAQQMDIQDLHSKFGNKYDGVIQQMLDYTKSLGH